MSSSVKMGTVGYFPNSNRVERSVDVNPTHGQHMITCPTLTSLAKHHDGTPIKMYMNMQPPQTME